MKVSHNIIYSVLKFCLLSGSNTINLKNINRCRPMLISLQDSTGAMVVLVTYTIIPKVGSFDLKHL